MNKLIAILFFVIAYSSSTAQSGLSDELKQNEDQLYASTKQLNQFFRRFNGEEDQEGNRLYDGDKKYRDTGLRKDFIASLIDQENSNISESTLKEFVKFATDKKNPCFVDLHSKQLISEVSAVYTHNGREIDMLMLMKIQPQGQGSEWVIDDIVYDGFKDLFVKDTSESKQFIHPMSHELEFMTLKKAFRNTQYPEQYTGRGFQPDYLTLFLFELKSDRLQFKTVKQVKFHIFDIDGWYFEISNFNRSGYNSGWLISNLTKVTDSQKNLLKNYIYDKN
ncbi:MAG: hypothetical protein JXR10_07770 [Cyclobacteriaceae bacterium]